MPSRAFWLDAAVFPVTRRELMLASRRKSTFWLRTLITGTGFLMCLVLLGASITPTGSAGLNTFRLVSGVAFAYALLSGLWLTAGTLSTESREGTLPLLYLTRLGRWELILSKLAGSSLRGFYGLIAMLPVAAVPVMAGGVTAREQWQTPLVLILTMLFSLCGGLAASALCREEEKAQGLAAFLVLLPVAAGWSGMLITFVFVLLAINRRTSSARHWFVWIYLLILLPACLWGFGATKEVLIGSPALAWNAALKGNTAALLVSLLLLVMMAIGYFVAAAYALPWEPVEEEAWSAQRAGRKRRRRSTAGDRPVEWLLARESPGTLLLLIAALLSVAPMFLAPLGVPMANLYVGRFLGGWVGMVPAGLLAFAVARQGAAGLASLKRTGFIEVLLSTPVSFMKLLAAQRAVFWSRMGRVVVLLVAADLFPWVWHLATSPETTAGLDTKLALLFGLTRGINTLFYFSALLWVGMQFGYSKGKTTAAAAWTMLCVMVLPGIVGTMTSLSLRWLAAPGSPWYFYSVYLLSLLGSILIYMGLIRWARIKLLGARVGPRPPRVLRGWLSPRMQT